MAPVLAKKVGAPKVAKVHKKKVTYKFVVNCKSPVEDGILKTQSFVEFLRQRVKYDGKLGQLEAGGIKIDSTKNDVTLTSDKEFSKRYLKYLTKKYLKKNTLRDWLRVISTDKNSYELKYFQLNDAESEAEGDE
uniref:60S ribosomal protein L22 n=1 Tax=Rhabditophanes sp. KR3021 TaxID=114890 RepID=A0AC35TM04_9BILA